MGKVRTILEAAYELMKTQYPGEFLLERFKEEMLRQSVFRTLFGDAGERIFLNEDPSLNDSIVPLVLLKYQSDTYGNIHTLLTGTINGTVIFPVKLRGKTDVFRKMGGVFQRWLGSRHKLFESVPGLTMIGENSSYRYDALAQYSGLTYPAMPFTLPYEFDLVVFAQMCPEIDLSAPLDADPLGLIRSYQMALKSDEGETLVTETIQVTGK